jgi:ElaB/YqjD/DUF883 family membrane-anchored ribosome-binding protein
MSEATKAKETNVSDEITVLKQDIARLTAAVADLVKLEASQARSKVEDVVVDLYNEGRDKLEQAGARAKGLSEDLNHTIERNPTTSVLTALGIGLIVGLLSRSRN